MPKFTVTLPGIRVIHDEVIMRTEPVEADYFRITEGALIFRNTAGATDPYPPTVRVFAAGHWAEVRQEIVTPAPVKPVHYDAARARLSGIDIGERV